MTLRDHVGRHVEVHGILNSQQQVASQSTTDRAPNATGTSRTTPTVSTTPDLKIRRLDVQQVKALEKECRVE